MKTTERDNKRLMDYIKEIEISKAIELEEVRAENKRLRKQLRLAGEFIDGSDKQYDRLLANVTGRVATVKPNFKDELRHGLISRRIKELRELE